jgi:general stress protein 26
MTMRSLLFYPILSSCIILFSFGSTAKAEEKLLAGDRDGALAAASTVIASDPYMTLITSDTAGQARARTIQFHGPDENFNFYVSTIPGTRKLQQIKDNPKVTLYFDNPEETAYVTVMGTATIHTDRETIVQHDWRTADSRARFWPDFPEGYVLIRIKPGWLEVVAPGIRARDSDWRPQAVVFSDP